MKVLFVNGSSHTDGTTMQAIAEMQSVFERDGIETEVIQLGAMAIHDCVQCGYCAKGNGCVFDEDTVNDFTKKAVDADGFVFASPVYYAHASGRLMSFLDRAFYSRGAAFRYKVGAAVAVARRAGTTSALDDITKYFGINQMPIAGSTYWNMVYGRVADDAQYDEEGIQTVRNLALNMIWLMRSIEAGKAAGIPLPNAEKKYSTSFIRR